jgi:hypothetical protein
MGKYQHGQCVPLQDGDKVIFCEILGEIGGGKYHCCLTRDLVERSAKRFLSMSTIHESLIDELLIVVD